jgi:hypothetical protein
MRDTLGAGCARAASGAVTTASKRRATAARVMGRPQHAGRLTLILNSIVALDQGVLVEHRIAEIEARLGTIKANDSARPEARA